MEQSRPDADLQRDEGPAAELDGLAELRRLVVGPERAQIIKLQERIENGALRSEDVGRVLPEAIIARARQNGDLASALSSTISEAIKTSVRKDPQPLIDAVFPVIGPAIRKSISEALMRMMQSLNQTIEYSLSAKSWRWRLEAWRTGKPFAEIVLLHTLAYRVEQVFLIHRNTGLLLQHVKAVAVAAQDGDMVSGMLTAIQDFVRDSFGGQENQTLDELRVGERTVWIVRGPQAVVAAVIWGIPRLDFKAKLQEACECIHGDQGAALEAFKGDTAPFELSRPCLEECLVQARQETIEPPKAPADPRRRRRWQAGMAAIGAALIVLLSMWLFFTIRQRSAFKKYVNELKSQPGIVVVSTGREGGKFTISGLRDPLAPDPQELLRHYSRLAGTKVEARWQPYQSLAPRFVLSRAWRSLSPPTTATLSLSDGVLYGHGKAPAGWIAEAQRLAPTLAGIASFDPRDLAPIDESPAVLQKAREVLIPPATVELSFREGVLRATGSAPAGWVQSAGRLALLIPGVDRWQDNVSDVGFQPGTLKEIEAILRPPPTIHLQASGDRLVLTGSASHAWIAHARAMSASLPGGLQYVADSVEDTDLAEFYARKEALETKRVVGYDDFFSVDPSPSQDKALDAIAADVKSLIGSAEAADVRMRVIVAGHTDSLGIDETRLQISQQRAERVVAILVSRGVPKDALFPVGVADHEPLGKGGADAALNRCVTFRVELLADHPQP